MRKLRVLLVTLLLPMAAAACSSFGMLGAMLGSQVTFTQPQLQHALDGHFPRRYERLGGLVTLDLTEPTLSIPYNANRLRLEFDVTLGASGRRSARGHLALSSGLRYDPATRGLHLHEPVIEALDVDGPGAAVDATGAELLQAWLADYARQEPVYRLSDSLVERIAGRRIDSTTIRDGVVVLNLGQ
ncbi:DUF1439 domain-containing protein [Lysobacter sp. GX 14042]|uniref:DUF1439 domain-containing protein n=1 Tax=Lysobacter sp. GX 14042 TaxID=2907155 RepID=UPI001F2E786A|nr:DUF1439 domain-containing protein [Lysobacter sp. GX 14042]MCE7031826.1 DUF1439 domain-containing protein [Lysobacter sp. GX 14042]